MQALEGETCVIFVEESLPLVEIWQEQNTKNQVE
jgi:hypothetical protein